MDKKLDSKLNLINNIPTELINKLPTVAENEIINKGKIELLILFGQQLDETKKAVESIGGKFDNLGFGYGVVTIEPTKIRDVGEISSIQYVELPKVLYTSDLQSNRASCIPSAWSSYKVTGKGVIIGVIDSGIDYTHPAFKNVDGTTRIEYIYDLSDNEKVYSKAQINEALKSKDPYSIVNVEDSNGHGTHVTGIAAGDGNIGTEYYGAAYEASIISVKVTKYGKANFALSTQIMRGIKFLLDKQNELNMPLAINISLSTNEGAHNGSSLLEQYINTITKLERVAIVVAAGNEGAAAHHVGGVLDKSVEIPLSISANERGLVLEVYKSILCLVSIEIKDSRGITSGEVFIEEGFKTIKSSQYDMLIYNTGPKPFDIDGEIIISILPNIVSLPAGTWTLTLRNKSDYVGKYDMWIPISESLNADTKFLRPNPYNTLGIPATTNGVISVGSYDYRTNNISAFSGRGAINAAYNKPDVVAPGENILSSVPGGRVDSKTGTSMAAPQVTGICALLLQWGIVDGNDGFLYGDRLKYYLNLGANRNVFNVVFPSPIWGYGKVCADKSFELLNMLIRGGVRGEPENDLGYMLGDIYIRLPK